MEHYDVIVIGAGTAGVAAALQAARENCRTLLVERTGQPGGTMTSTRNCCPGLFHAWGRQIIAGIGWELVRECAALSGQDLPDFTAPTDPREHWKCQISLNPACYALLCDEKMTSAKVERLYHAMLAEARFDGRQWHLTLCTTDGLRPVAGGILLDCTGDASAAALAGFARVIPEECQPSTLCCRLSGYDFRTLDRETLLREAGAAMAEGRLRPTDLSWNALDFGLRFLSQYGGNANHLFGPSAASADERSRLEIEGRASVLRAYRFLRRQKGLERLTLEEVAPETGVRESATIVGEHQITAEEYISGCAYPDAVCYGFYPLDMHEKSSDGVRPRPLREGTVPQIPLRALIPRGSRNLLAAGRCLASDRVANSALRVQAAAMATGQAAGAAAVVAVRTGTTPLEADFPELRRLLRKHGAIVPQEGAPEIDAASSPGDRVRI